MIFLIKHLENTVYVYDKSDNLLFIFDGKNDAESEESLSNQMTNPVISWHQNGESSLSFQLLANSWAWCQIKSPENRYFVNGRVYTPLNENSYVYFGEGNARIVNVTCVEEWYLLSRQYHQIYNCGLYTTARSSFQKYVSDGAIFTIKSTDCSTLSNTISPALAWNQVKLWTSKDNKGNDLAYTILKSEDNKPTGWDDAPTAVLFKDVTVSGNTMTVKVTSAIKGEVTHNFDYSRTNTYTINSKPLPEKLNKVVVNITNITSTTQSSTTTYKTYEKTVNYTYNNSTGTFSIQYNTTGGETINYVSATYEYCNIGDIKSGATCTFAYGAEVVDEHTFLVLPKADKKYKLTIDGVEYDDNDVKDSRGVVMPRGSAGYAMWAALKNSGWKLGICDVLAIGFDPSIDYGCFNLETDQKDTLYNINNIQELYGGILDWDSRTKTLNYRAENNTDYQAYQDGFNDWTGYEFRMGKNMQDQPEVTIDNNLITRGYLLGYGNLNVKEVNGGKSYIDDFSFTANIYEGYLSQPLIYDTRDTSGMNQLLYWGKKELAKMCRPRKSIKVNVFDIRTVEGYEHEVFDINNIVRVFSKETDTDEETYEEKRIVGWEYEVFAPYNSTIELGDKTSNLSEIFKLIYNMTMDAPKTDGSGNISSSDIVNDRGESLPQYLEIMARTTTSNTDAIAALQLQTTNLYSQVDLFAMYQSQLDNLFTQTYAGLSFYADQVGSKVYTTVSGEYRDAINNSANMLQAGFIASQQQQEGAWAQQFASYTSIVDGKIQKNEASITTMADRLNAGIQMHVSDTNGELTFTMSSTGILINGQQSYSTTVQPEPYGYEDVYDVIHAITDFTAFHYNDDTFIDGSCLMTGTVTASYLQGGRIEVYDAYGDMVGYMSTVPSTATGYSALTIHGYDGLAMSAHYGDLFLSTTTNGRDILSAIQLGNDGSIAILAPGGLTVNGQPIGS